MNYAFFVDYENVYREVCNGIPGEGDAHDVALEVVQRTVRMLEAEGARVLVSRAYADWENLSGHGVQSSLALLSVRPEYVMAKRGKSSADLELSLSALEILLTRDDIDGFVILGGDRDYIPVMSRIRESGKRTRVVGFSRSTSGDLIGLVGAANFTDATRFARNGLFPAWNGAARMSPYSKDNAGCAPTSEAQSFSYSNSGGAVGGAGGSAYCITNPSEEDLARCLRLVCLATTRVGKEVWLGPFFKNYMNEEFAAFNNAQRKSIIQLLREKDAIGVETRTGSYMGGTYSVLLLNEEHPEVKAIMEELALESGGDAGEVDGGEEEWGGGGPSALSGQEETPPVSEDQSQPLD